MAGVRNDKATVYVGNVPPDADEDLIWELGTQFGVVRKVNMPRDRLTGVRDDFCFVEFNSQLDAKYMADVLTIAPVELFGKKLKVSYKGDDRWLNDSLLEIGAKLCVRHLDMACDEAALTEHFGQFGGFAIPPRLLRTPTGASRGIAFLSYDTFDAADAALAAAEGSFYMNKRIAVSYADKADGSGGKHGSEEERAMFAEGSLATAAFEEQVLSKQQEALPNTADAVGGGPAWAQGFNPYGA
jgi:splicing factor 3B subunit 4